MKTKNDYHQFNDKELMVLAFLKNLKQYAPETFDYLVYYGASAKEMIKFMEHPEKYNDFGFVCSLFRAIDMTFKHYVIECPEIPVQIEEDRILAAILMYSSSAFMSIYAHERLINRSHLHAYLMRKDEIYKWNGLLLFVVQRIVEEMKAEMKLKFEITG